MNQINLWYNEREKMYYSEAEFDCTNCREKINDYMLLALFWNKKHSWLSTYCKKCFRKISESSLIQERRIVILSSPPALSYPILLRPPSLINSKQISVWEISKIDDKFPQSKTIDLRKHTPVLDGTERIGNPDLDRIKELDASATEEDIKLLEDERFS